MEKKRALKLPILYDLKSVGLWEDTYTHTLYISVLSKLSKKTPFIACTNRRFNRRLYTSSFSFSKPNL